MGLGLRCVQGWGWRGGLGDLPTALVVLSAGGMCSTLFLLPTSCFCPRLFRSGSWIFRSLCYLWCKICLNWAFMQLFLFSTLFYVHAPSPSVIILFYGNFFKCIAFFSVQWTRFDPRGLTLLTPGPVLLLQAHCPCTVTSSSQMTLLMAVSGPALLGWRRA